MLLVQSDGTALEHWSPTVQYSTVQLVCVLYKKSYQGCY